MDQIFNKWNEFPFCYLQDLFENDHLILYKTILSKTRVRRNKQEFFEYIKSRRDAVRKFKKKIDKQFDESCPYHLIADETKYLHIVCF